MSPCSRAIATSLESTPGKNTQVIRYAASTQAILTTSLLENQAGSEDSAGSSTPPDAS